MIKLDPFQVHKDVVNICKLVSVVPHINKGQKPSIISRGRKSI